MNLLEHIPSIRNTIPSLFENEDDFKLIPLEYVEQFKKWGIFYINNRLSEVKVNKQKEYIQFSGVPCSGKNTYLDSNFKGNNNFIIIEADAIMLDMPFYKSDLNKGMSKESLFSQWEIPARILSYKLLLTSIDKGLSIIHNTGGFAEVNIEIIEQVKKNGYLIKHIHFDIPSEIALKRLNDRNKLSGQYTPIEYIIERQEEINKLLPHYIKLSHDYLVIKNY